MRATHTSSAKETAKSQCRPIREQKNARKDESAFPKYRKKKGDLSFLFPIALPPLRFCPTSFRTTLTERGTHIAHADPSLQPVKNANGTARQWALCTTTSATHSTRWTPRLFNRLRLLLRTKLRTRALRSVRSAALGLPPETNYDTAGAAKWCGIAAKSAHRRTGLSIGVRRAIAFVEYTRGHLQITKRGEEIRRISDRTYAT